MPTLDLSFRCLPGGLPGGLRTGLLSVAVAALGVSAAPSVLVAQDAKDQLARFIDERADSYAQVAQNIWELAEVGYMEYESSSLLQQQLRDAGFRVEAGVAGIPTAFVAEWGQGGSVVGIMAEFDALPGINQDRSSERLPIDGKIAGHACGHHLFGTGSVAAAIAVKDWLERSGEPGRIRLYGTPAEEGGAGKVYMVRAGLMNDVDAMLHWHAGDANSAAATGSLANKSAKFRFSGISAHASSAPWRGRSALDAVEAMNMMVNMMREHVEPESRIHYVITSGGSAPNVIPDKAEAFYYVRHPDPAMVHANFERVVAAAEGAALGTGTTMEYEIIHGIYNLLVNEPLAQAMHNNLERVGGVDYTDAERDFGAAIQESFGYEHPALETAQQVANFYVDPVGRGGSTDVGDVSWMVPTAGLRTATWVPGTASHSWQAVAAGGTDIGNKGMINAAKTLAMTAYDLFTNPALIEAAKAEFVSRRGDDFQYDPLIGDRDPPLDYRADVMGGAGGGSN
jgi:aminobenzoyl-glutamate utilization protein B